MGMPDALFVVLLEIIVNSAMVLVGKALFEESIVVDKKTAVLVSGTIVMDLIGYFSGLEDVDLKYILLNIASYGLVFWIFIRGPIKRLGKRIRALFDIYLAFMISAGAYCTCVFFLLRPGSVADDSYLYTGEFDCFYALFCLLYALYVYKEVIRRKICLNLKFWERFLMIFFGLAVCILMAILQVEISDGVYENVPAVFRVIIVICISLMYVGFPMLLIKSKLSFHYEMGEKHQQEIVALELKHFEQYKESQEETRRFRHDMVNNLQAVQMLQAQGKDREAREYVDELLGRMQTLSPRVVTGCDLLDCILASKLERMEQLGIAYTIEGVFDRGLDLSPVDICAIFANAVDNAMEACEKIEGERRFSMKIKKTQALYCVVMENTMAPKAVSEDKIKEIRFTTKKNKELHGYGLSTIQKTVRRVGGDSTVEALQDRFVLTLMLPWKAFEG